MKYPQRSDSTLIRGIAPSFCSRLWSPTTGPVPEVLSAPVLLRTTTDETPLFRTAAARESVIRSWYARTSAAEIFGGITAYTARAPAKAFSRAAVSLMSAVTASAPFCASRSSRLASRPMTRTLAPFASSLSAAMAPVCPVAPVITYMFPPYESGHFAFSSTATLRGAGCRMLDEAIALGAFKAAPAKSPQASALKDFLPIRVPPELPGFLIILFIFLALYFSGALLCARHFSEEGAAERCPCAHRRARNDRLGAGLNAILCCEQCSRQTTEFGQRFRGEVLEWPNRADC